MGPTLVSIRECSEWTPGHSWTPCSSFPASLCGVHLRMLDGECSMDAPWYPSENAQRTPIAPFPRPVLRKYAFLYSRQYATDIGFLAGTPSVFGMLRLDPETVLILLTTTRIPGQFYRTGTVVGPCSVDDLRSCVVTSALMCGHVHGHDQTPFSCPRYNRDRG